MSEQHTPFLTIFPGCGDLGASCGGLDKAYVTQVQVDMSARTMSVCAWFAAMPSPAEESILIDRLREDYGLTGAVSFFQSAVGCFMVVTVNLIVRKIAPDNALF